MTKVIVLGKNGVYLCGINLLKKMIMETLKLKIFSVTFETSDHSESLYYGTDEKEARDMFEQFDIDDIDKRYYFRNDMSVRLSVCVETYEHVGGDKYKMEDYQLDEYYNDEDVYKLVDEGEFEVVDEKKIHPINYKSDMLLEEVSTHYRLIYGYYKYFQKSIYDENDNYLGRIQVRIADHTGNIDNAGRYDTCNYYLSVVICDYDVTAERFFVKNQFENTGNYWEIYFNSDNTKEEVIAAIEEKIKEIINLLN